MGELGSNPGFGRSPGGDHGNPLQYSCLENCMDCSPWGVKELDTTEQLSLQLWGFGNVFALNLTSMVTSKKCILYDKLKSEFVSQERG